MKRIISAVLFGGLIAFSSCGQNELREKEAALQAKQQALDSMSQAVAHQRVVDSMNAVLASRDQARTDSIRLAEEQKAAAAATASAAAARTTRSSSSTRSRRRSYGGSSQPVAQAPVPVSNDIPAEQPKKKGWSAKAKGAVIGAGTGAAAGAIINGRNRAAGAVIGGVIGAAAGTGAGAIIDKKNGRNKK